MLRRTPPGQWSSGLDIVCTLLAWKRRELRGIDAQRDRHVRAPRIPGAHRLEKVLQDGFGVKRVDHDDAPDPLLVLGEAVGEHDEPLPLRLEPGASLEGLAVQACQAGLGLPDEGFARAVPVPPLLPILKALADLPGEDLLVLGVGLAAIPCEALVRFETTTPSGFGVFLCTSFG